MMRALKSSDPCGGERARGCFSREKSEADLWEGGVYFYSSLERESFYGRNLQPGCLIPRKEAEQGMESRKCGQQYLFDVSLFSPGENPCTWKSVR